MTNWFDSLQVVERIGEIEQYLGLKLVAKGPPQTFVGEICEILDTRNQTLSQAEVIGFDKTKVFLMPLTSAKISLGFKVRATGNSLAIPVGKALLGRVIDALGKPLDSLGRLHCKEQSTLYKSTINPLLRQPIQERLLTGIHAIDCFLPLGKGQRLGLFAGSGVGKSVLLGMITRQINSDINVIG